MRRTNAKKPARPLVVTGDAELLDELLRLSASSGIEFDVAQDIVAARRGYSLAPLVLLGSDVVIEGSRVSLPRREGLVIVCRVHNDPQAWNLAYDLGAEHVAMLPVARPWLLERLSKALRIGSGKGKVVAVVGGRGGAGASVLAAGLSVTGVREGLRTLLVDADPLGGGVDLLFGWEQEHGLRWPQLAEAGGHLDPQTLVNALPNRGDLVLLSCDRIDPEKDDDVVPKLLPDVMQAALEAGRLGRDLVVVDVPRRLDEAAEFAIRAADHALMVVTPELRATAAAARVAASVLLHRQALSVVVRDTTSGGMSAAEIRKVLDLPLAGRLKSEPRLVEALEKGDPPAANSRGPLASFCRKLLKGELS